MWEATGLNQASSSPCEAVLLADFAYCATPLNPFPFLEFLLQLLWFSPVIVDKNLSLPLKMSPRLLLISFDFNSRLSCSWCNKWCSTVHYVAITEMSNFIFLLISRVSVVKRSRKQGINKKCFTSVGMETLLFPSSLLYLALKKWK